MQQTKLPRNTTMVPYQHTVCACWAQQWLSTISFMKYKSTCTIIRSSLILVWFFSSLLLTVTPNVTAISADQVVTSPDSVTLSCTVHSYPSSNITWLHNGAEVQVALPRVTISTVQVDNRTQESTLTLLNTTAEDTGTYTCSAVNIEGLTNKAIEIQVFGE